MRPRYNEPRLNDNLVIAILSSCTDNFTTKILQNFRFQYIVTILGQYRYIEVILYCEFLLFDALIMPVERRKAITHTQRKALRIWYFRQQPRPTHKGCIAWFETEFGHKLSQSTISESLSGRFAYLDSIEDSSASRNRTANWEELEKVLYEWFKTLELRGANISGDLLVEKARHIWGSLPQYQHTPPPQFSSGWLHRFKQRFNIKQRNHHGEAASVDEKASIEMAAIRTLAGSYAEDDIYNMDETGLFWRMSPSRGLTTQSRPGSRKDKTRISIVCCANASGSDRFPLWFIGKARQPRALRSINISAMGGQWQSNSKAWMNSFIMKDWLLAFYKHIGSRTVLLTMDNFSAHLSGLELAPPPPNIRIQWLPANSTSRFQPLDQGIIQNFKVYYRKQWLRYMLYAYENQWNPIESVTILDAVRWCLRAWNHDVLSTTINSCFRKSTLVAEPIQLPIESPDLTALFAHVQQAGSISDAMNLTNFLNPAEECEAADDSNLGPDDLLQQIIANHIELPEDDEEDDDPAPTPPAPTLAEALHALKLIISYSERQEDSETSTIRALEQYERQLERKASDLAVQTTLDNWLTTSSGPH